MFADYCGEYGRDRITSQRPLFFLSSSQFVIVEALQFQRVPYRESVFFVIDQVPVPVVPVTDSKVLSSATNRVRGVFLKIFTQILV